MRIELERRRPRDISWWSASAPAAYRLLVGARSPAPLRTTGTSGSIRPKSKPAAAGRGWWSEDLDDQALAALDAGGKVLLFIPPDRVKGDKLGKVGLASRASSGTRPGPIASRPRPWASCAIPSTPPWPQFPTEFHSNWQWWYLVSRAGAMILDDLPKELRPTVQVIDDWVTSRKLGLVFEAQDGRRQAPGVQHRPEQRPGAEPGRAGRCSTVCCITWAAQNSSPRSQLSPAEVRSLMVACGIARLGAAL